MAKKRPLVLRDSDSTDSKRCNRTLGRGAFGQVSLVGGCAVKSVSMRGDQASNVLNEVAFLPA